MSDKPNLPSSPAPNKPVTKAASPAEYRAQSAIRRFELSYGMDKFYLTQEERNAFLNAIRGGSDSVQIGEMTLSRFFKYIIPLENPPQPQSQEDQKLINLAEKQRN